MSEPPGVNDGPAGRNRPFVVRVGKLLTFFGLLCTGASLFYSSDFGFGSEITVNDVVGGPIHFAMWKVGIGILVVGVLVLAGAVRSYGFLGVFERPRWRWGRNGAHP